MLLMSKEKFISRIYIGASITIIFDAYFDHDII